AASSGKGINRAKLSIPHPFAQKGSIQFKIIRKRLYRESEFAIMRSALEQCVGKTLFKHTVSQ
ncbi:hypothetical protein, partial [Vibrio anguillarum]|uniref:hypothetical protein n=1 Tax=Vibrio anguillarum TaxID=55601 RepID=UPI001A7E0655